MQFHPLQQALTHLSFDDNEAVSKEYFNENYGFPNIPVLFKQAFHQWDIRSRWTPDYLAEKISGKDLPENLSDNKDVQAMTLKEYLANGTGEYYYKTNRHLQSDLRNEYSTPGCFNCWYAATNIGQPKNRLSWLYVGIRGSFSELHRDIWFSSAWNYLISGRKLWLIYPSMYSDIISQDKERYKLKNKDVNGIAAETFRPLVCIQESGEMIFVPGNYYHAVLNLEDSVSLTENFLNETNYENVRQYFKSSGNKKNIGDIEAIIKEGFDRIKTHHPENDEHEK